MNHGGCSVLETQIELKEPLDTSSPVGGRLRLRRHVCEHNFHFKGIWFFPGNTLRLSFLPNRSYSDNGRPLPATELEPADALRPL
ncbi:hypothetical protein D4764_20G0005430 [Takifugu flavidus]|uniref:Uncharacterized protein n=1 Tax=Takifugu flavidus TaxID=433684 RepID=A0A5C6NIQ7_9TELE|nr:hypothetical protein D4764_20G0005430 [Takifugu flavidus]